MLTLTPRRFTVTLDTKQGRIVFDNKDQGLNLKLVAALKGEKGDEGDSAYEVAVGAGFAGDVNAWLASLVGPQGDEGDSAYEVAVSQGFSGDVNAWLASLVGPPGADSFVPGPPGDSAYEVAVDAGFSGDVNAWLASLVGPPGVDGEVTNASLASTLTGYQTLIAPGNTGQFYRGDKAWSNLLEGSLGIVDAAGSAVANVNLSLSALIAGGGGTRRALYASGAANTTNSNSTVNYIETLGATVGAAGNNTIMRHYYATQGVFARSVITQYGFAVDSTLTGATTNYGFYSGIAAANARWNFYAAGDASNYFAGRLTLGSVTTTGFLIRNSLNANGSTAVRGFGYNGTVQSDVTTTFTTFESNPSTQAAAFSLGTLRHFYANMGSLGAGSAVTTHIGFDFPSTEVGTNIRAFQGDLSAGSGRFNLYMSGSAMNYMAGPLGIGNSGVTSAYGLYINKTYTGGSSGYGIRMSGTIASDVTVFTGVESNPGSFAAPSMTAVYGFHAQAPSAGAGCVLSHFSAFRAGDNTSSAAALFHGFYSYLDHEPGGQGLSYTVRTINNVEVASNVVTVTTSAAHGFIVGQIISHNFGTNTQLNGSKVVTATPTTTTYTFSQTTANVASMADTGSATPLRRWAFYSQGSANSYFTGRVLIGTSNTPVQSALLSMSSTTQGFLPPVMTSGQRTAIANPVAGLMVYNSTLAAPDCYNGTTWQRVGWRVPALTTAAQPGGNNAVITSDSIDGYTVTAASAGFTIAAPSGTPSDGQEAYVRIKDNGTPRTLTWNAIWRAIGVTLPTTTVANKTHYIFAKYNSADTKWDVYDVKQEA